MLDWFRRRKDLPVEVGRAIRLERDIRDQSALADAENAYRELADLAKACPQYPDIRRLQANAALNLMRRRPDSRGADDRTLLEDVELIADSHQNEGVLRECLVHLYWAYMAALPADRLAECVEIQARQFQLYSSFPEVRKHSDPVVRSLMKLMTDYLIVGEIEAAQQIYERIESVANQHLDDGDIQFLRCGSALNLISRLANADDMGPKEMELARGYGRALVEFAGQSHFSDDLTKIVEAAQAMVVEERPR